MRIMLRGPFNVYSGYGNDLVGMARALTDLGHDVVPLPTMVLPGLPEDVAHLFTKSLHGRFDVGITHVPPFDLRPPATMVTQCDLVVGWSMWEQSRLERTEMRGRKQGRNPWKELDLLLAYDPVSMEAFDTYDPKTPKLVLQGGVDPEPWPYLERDWDGTFRFCMAGELHQRKDPFVAIDAFRELRYDGALEDAELWLKTNMPGLHPAIEEWVPGVHVLMRMLNTEQMLEFYADKHVLISPSRGEGKNLPAMEMMLTGGTTIATAWGGHTVWQDDYIGFALDYQLRKVNPAQETMNARVSKEHLKQLMMKAYENRDECRQMGRRASRKIREQHSWDAVCRRLVEIIGETCPRP